MIQSNEFDGADLREAVKKATVAYHCGDSHRETKSFCHDLIRNYEIKSRQLDRLLDRMVDLQREVDGLERQARLEALVAAATSLAVTERALAKRRQNCWPYEIFAS